MNEAVTGTRRNEAATGTRRSEAVTGTRRSEAAMTRSVRGGTAEETGIGGTMSAPFDGATGTGLRRKKRRRKAGGEKRRRSATRRGVARGRWSSRRPESGRRRRSECGEGRNCVASLILWLSGERGDEGGDRGREGDKGREEEDDVTEELKEEEKDDGEE